MLTPTNTSRRAFTLIELLVVIAIISLLVSILLPSLTKARELARNTVCATQVRSQAMAMEFYLEDSEGVYPRTLHRHIYWFEHLRDSYLDMENSHFFCPSDTRVNTTLEATTWNISYGANESGPCPNSSSLNHNRNEIARPDKMILLCDSDEQQENTWGFHAVSGIWNPIQYGPGSRHINGSNVAFCDGHVAAMTLEELVWDGSDPTRDAYHDLWFLFPTSDPYGGW